MGTTSVEVFSFKLIWVSPESSLRKCSTVIWKWRSVSSGWSRAVRVRIGSFLMAAGYFLVLFAYFKTETLFIRGSFSLSARHSSGFSPTHHLFYNKTHHSHGLWVPFEFTEFPHSSGQNPTLSAAIRFSAQAALYLYRKAKQSISLCCVTYSVSTIIYNLPSFTVTTYRRLQQNHTYSCVFPAHFMQFAFTIQPISVCLVD